MRLTFTSLCRLVVLVALVALAGLPSLSGCGSSTRQLRIRIVSQDNQTQTLSEAAVEIGDTCFVYKENMYPETVYSADANGVITITGLTSALESYPIFVRAPVDHQDALITLRAREIANSKEPITLLLEATPGPPNPDPPDPIRIRPNPDPVEK